MDRRAADGREGWGGLVTPEWVWSVVWTAVVVAAVNRDRVAPVPCPRWLGRWAEASYALYLTHFVVMWTAFRLTAPLPVVLGLPVALGLTLAAGWTWYVAVERPLVRGMGGRR